LFDLTACSFRRGDSQGDGIRSHAVTLALELATGSALSNIDYTVKSTHWTEVQGYLNPVFSPIPVPSSLPILEAAGTLALLSIVWESRAPLPISGPFILACVHGLGSILDEDIIRTFAPIDGPKKLRHWPLTFDPAATSEAYLNGGEYQELCFAIETPVQLSPADRSLQR
jgi:hypothetical protein